MLRPRPGGRVATAAEATMNRWLACVLTSLRQRPPEGLSPTEARATDHPKGRPPNSAATSWARSTEVVQTFEAASRG